MSCLTRQIAEQSPILCPELETFHKNFAKIDRAPTDDERLTLLRSVSRPFKVVYLFVDALVIIFPERLFFHFNSYEYFLILS